MHPLLRTLRSRFTLSLVVAAFAAPGMAAVVETDSYQAGQPYPVPAGELNLGLSGSPATVATQEGATSPNVSVLSDGTNGKGDFSDSTSTVVSIGNGQTITYNFPTPMTITGINTYSEWRDQGRINQDYTVSTSTNGTTFSPLQTVAYDAPGASGIGQGGIDALVQLTSDAGPLADGVTAVQFSFPNTQNNYVGYTELAILGTQNTPEPSTLALLGLGTLSLLGRRCRRPA